MVGLVGCWLMQTSFLDSFFSENFNENFLLLVQVKVILLLVCKQVG